MQVLSFGLTDVGVKRTGNEDSLICQADLGLYAVADGMGGHAAGEIASGQAVATVEEIIRRSTEEEDAAEILGGSIDRYGRILEMSVQEANRAICRLSEENAAQKGMGTTLSAILIREEWAAVAHVGDSRIYIQRNGNLEKVTSDHSWVNEQLQRNLITPEEAKTHRWRNVITRALGNRAEVEVDTLKMELHKGDCFLLCSDGLTGMIEENTIQQTLETMGDSLELACRDLVEKAKEAGGDDNITVIILKVAE